ncbi:MAG: hypothetical protein BMS9Abin33_1166 [Gammaproteobacteria bacterium]|nr:MAG: hypothetical protein BMS9Abin33_1166 [Gammaproteobacteria bacterium]
MVSTTVCFSATLHSRRASKGKTVHTNPMIEPETDINLIDVWPESWIRVEDFSAKRRSTRMSGAMALATFPERKVDRRAGAEPRNRI